ncbi:MAG: LCP family protein [Acidimicrobiia bacterium]
MTTDAVVPGPADGTGDEPPPALGTDGAPAATAAPDAGVAEPEGAPVGVLAPGDGTTPATGPAPVSERRRHPRPTSRRGRAVARRAGRAGVAAWADGVAVAGGGPGDGGSERAPAPAEAGAVGSGAARRRAALTPERLRRRRALVLGAMAGLTLGGVALAVVGVTEVRTSTAGRYQEELGPDDPGYEAYVVPSPTLAVLHRGADGSLVGAALIALAPEDHGGSVVVVPTSAVVVREGGEATIAEVYRTEGAEAAASAVGQAVTAAAAEHVEVDDARWRDLVAPVGGLEVSIDAPVGEWEAGRVELRPEDVGAFLAARAEGESELERVERQLQFWNAWLPQVAAGGEDVLPGEVETGIGRFVRGVARGEGSAAALPVVRDGAGEGEDERFRTDAGRVHAFVSRAVPYPTSPVPGARVRVRLLNGTGDPSLTPRAARALVAGGAEVVIAGNTATPGVERTRILYLGEDRAHLARWIRANLDLGRVEETASGQDGRRVSDDEIDVTVVLGDDAEEQIER